MTTRPESGGDAMAVIGWAVPHWHAIRGARRVTTTALLEHWFADAADRWPSAWLAARRSPTALLWLASRAAARESFDPDALELFEERSALRESVPGTPGDIAQVVAIGDVLRTLGAISPPAAETLPVALHAFAEGLTARAA